MRSILILAAITAFAVVTSPTPVSALTFTVSKTADTDDGICDADCSLREAIRAANLNLGSDTIEFAIPGAGVQLLDVSMGQMPDVTDPVLIDGLSQPGASCAAWPATLLIQLDGSGIVGTPAGFFFTTGSSGSELRGMVITGYGNSGANIGGDTSNISVLCNYLGVQPDGVTAGPNTDGLIVGGSGHQVGGGGLGQRNLISGNGAGIRLFGDGTVVEGNYIGVDVSGNGALGNAFVGVLVGGSNHRIGGTGANDGNLISANGLFGVLVTSGPPGFDITIVGNIIGSNADGTSALLGNGSWGISVDFGAGSVQIGGTAPGSGNLVAANGDGAILAENGDNGLNSDATVIEGNFFGTNLAGTATLGGGLIQIEGEGHVIGGVNPAARNITHEIFIDGSFNRVLGNNICWALDGVTPLGGCDDGMTISLGAFNEIGGIAGNLIRGVSTAITVTDPGAGGGNVLSNNIIGLDAMGQPAAVGPDTGVFIGRVNPNVVNEPVLIADNVISNCGTGIDVVDHQARILGNRIGTDIAGLAAIPNQQGISYTRSIVEIGSGLPGEGNLISGNAGPAIWGLNSVDGQIGVLVRGATIAGNLIGVDATGLTALPNDQGIVIAGPGVTVIGGSDQQTGNVIAGNLGAGVSISDDCLVVTSDTTEEQFIANNLIGVGSDGVTPIGNGGLGIELEACAPAGELREVIVGQVTPNQQDQGNVISANLIGIGARNVTFSRIVGNFIGTDRSATVALGNVGDGLRFDSSSEIFVGEALGDGVGNVITANGGQGVAITGEPFTGTAIWGNSIYDNGGLGIDLLEPSTGDGVVTLNDPGDLDSTGGGDGPHDLQNFPVIDSAISLNGTTQVLGSLSSLPNRTYFAEIFANDSCDPSGHGEAQTSLGLLILSTDDQGEAVIDATFPVGLGESQFVTATAIDSLNQTSEISMCTPVDANGIVEIPTLGNWGLALMATLLCLVAVTRRRLGL